MTGHAAGIRAVPLAVLMIISAVPPTYAQQPPASSDSLRLPSLIAEALHSDPRARQVELQSRASALRQQSIDAERLPAISGTGQAQYQSEVTTLPIHLPGGTSIPVPPHDTYDARVDAQEPLLDPTRAPRRAVERAQLGEATATVRTTLYTLRTEVEEAFFTAADLQERAASVDATIGDLEARLAEMRDRYRAGAALPGDTATIAAALLQRRQDALQISAQRRAALARLGELVGRTISPGVPLALPPTAAPARVAAEAVIAGDSSLRARPEFAQFEATRARIAQQEALSAAERRPRLGAYARAGYGKPALNMLSSSFSSYWLAGLQVQWAPWNWGTDRRDREELELQREIVQTNEAALERSLHRNAQTDVATIDQLDSTLALDDAIVALRETIVRETRAQLEEHVATASTYVDRGTDLLTARLARAEHRVALAQARVHLLTSLGLEVP